MRKKPSHREDEAQALFFNTLSQYYPRIRPLTFAIPNGGFRNPLEAKRLKSQGVTPGVPDIFCACGRSKFLGLFIEKGTLSPSQKDMIERLSLSGYKVTVCHGAHEALSCILEYWNLPPA